MAGSIEAPQQGGGKFGGPGPLFADTDFRPDRHLKLPDYVINNLQLLPPKLGKEIGNRLVDALSNPIMQQISSGVDKVLDASSVAFNKVSLEIGNALGGNRLQPLAVTVGDHQSQSLFDADVTQSVRAAFVAQTIAGTMQHPGMYAFQFDPQDLDAFRQTLIMALKKSPGKAIKEKWKTADTQGKILMAGGAGIVGALALEGAFLVLADACSRFTPTPPGPTTGPQIGGDHPLPPTIGVSCDTKTLLPSSPSIGGQPLETPQAVYAAFNTHMQAKAKDLGVSVLVTDTLEYGPTGFTAVGAVTCSSSHEQDGRQVFLADNSTGTDGTMVILPPVAQYPEGTIADIQNGKLVFVEPNVKTPTGDAFAIGELSAGGTVIEYPRVISINNKGVVVRSDHALSAARISGLVQNDIALISRDKDSIFKDGNSTWVKVVMANGTIGWVSLYDANGDQLIGFNNTGTDVLMSAKPVTPTLAPSPTAAVTEAPKATKEPTVVPTKLPEPTATLTPNQIFDKYAPHIKMDSADMNSAVLNDLKYLAPYLTKYIKMFAANDISDPKIKSVLDQVYAKHPDAIRFPKNFQYISDDPLKIFLPRPFYLQPYIIAAIGSSGPNADAEAEFIGSDEIKLGHVLFDNSKYHNELLRQRFRQAVLLKEIIALVMNDYGASNIQADHMSIIFESLFLLDHKDEAFRENLPPSDKTSYEYYMNGANNYAVNW